MLKCRPLQGSIDEFRIYNYALTPDEIKALVSACKAPDAAASTKTLSAETTDKGSFFSLTNFAFHCLNLLIPLKQFIPISGHIYVKMKIICILEINYIFYTISLNL